MGMHAFEAKERELALVVDTDAELAHWRINFRELPNCRKLRWDDVKPALKLGIDACLKARGRDITEMLDELKVNYRRTAADSRLEWDQASEVVAAAWVRVWQQNSAHDKPGPFMHLGRISQRLRAH